MSESDAVVSEGGSDEDHLLLEEDGPQIRDAGVVDEVISLISSILKGWSRPDKFLEFEGTKWKPHLVGDKCTLHVHLTDAIPRHIQRRLRAASREMEVYVALRIEALYDEAVLRLLSEIDGQVILLEGDSSEVTSGDYLLAALADKSVPVTATLRRDLAAKAWARRSTGTTFEKGRQFEALSAFLLSQVDGFRIFERNYLAETDEIDIIVQVDKLLDDRCWCESGVPFVLVEAKNWKKTVGSNVVSLLIRKLETRRGRARIGLLFATSKISPEAREEELKEARGSLCVAMLGPEEIEAWIGAKDPDRFLNELIARAMLR